MWSFSFRRVCSLVTLIGAASAATLTAMPQGSPVAVGGAATAAERSGPALSVPAGVQGSAPDAQEAVTARPRRFQTEGDALEWIADRAASLRARTVLRHRDSARRLVGVTVVQAGSASDNTRAEQTLLAELGGRDGQTVIGNRVISLRQAVSATLTGAPDNAFDAAALGAQSQCSGNLCTDDSSFKNNYYLYRSIGSQTKVTSGAGRRYVTSVPGIFLFPGPGGMQICRPASPCPAGTVPQGSRQCFFRCYSQTTTAIRLSVTFFANGPNDILLPFLVEPEPIVGASAEVKLTQWGVLLGNGGVKSQCDFGLGGSVECSLVGVCTRHETRSSDGRVTLVTTSAGRTDACGS